MNIALPTIAASFSVDVALSQWTITAGQALFTLGSLACGLSATLAQLVIFRVIQAVGGAMVFSISGAILFLSFPPEERGRAMGYLGSTVAAGSILGPILGGFLVDSLGWRYIFLINLPIGIVLLVVPVVMVAASPVTGLLYDRLIPSQQSVDLPAAPAKTLGPVDAGHAYSSATSIAIRAQSQRLCGL